MKNKCSNISRLYITIIQTRLFCKRSSKFLYFVIFLFNKTLYFSFLFKGNCLELAADGILNNVNCNDFIKGCPDEAYISNEIFMCMYCILILDFKSYFVHLEFLYRILLMLLCSFSFRPSLSKFGIQLFHIRCEMLTKKVRKK